MVKKYLKEFNDEEVKVIKEITTNLLNKSDAKGSELMILFDYWKKLFPTVKMELNCASCRKTVVKFFTHLVA